MDEIPITDLSTRVLEGIRNLGLREQAVRQLERNGIQPILAYFQENGRSVYSKEPLEQLVWRERLKMESGVLRPERWRFLRRVASFFEQMASQGRIEETPMPKWEAEHNILFQPADRSPEKANEIETLALLTRDEVLKLDLQEKTILDYLHCGFGAILKYFKAKGETAYSQETLNVCVRDAWEKFERGEMGRFAFQHIRKTALWIEEYRNTGKITHRKLSNFSFAYVNPNYERLIEEYREHMDSIGCLKESVRKNYAWSARRFFRQMEELDHFEYRELCLADIAECLEKVGG